MARHLRELVILPTDISLKGKDGTYKAVDFMVSERMFTFPFPKTATPLPLATETCEGVDSFEA